MAKYRKKPVVIEAVQLPVDENASNEIIQFVDEHPEVTWNDKMAFRGGVTVRTLEGNLEGRPGWWLIKGVKGEVYACAPDIFEQTYERAD